MTTLSDEILIQFSQGDDKAFQAIFDSFRARILFFTSKLLNGNMSIAEEITSDTFVKLYRLRDRFNTFNNVQAFLYITARNACLDFLKFQKRQRHHLHQLRYQEPHSELPVIESTSIEADVIKLLYEEIEKLPQRCKLIFKLYLEGCSVSEIADLMNISPQTVANQKHNALKALRLKLLNRHALWCCVLYFLYEHQ